MGEGIKLGGGSLGVLNGVIEEYFAATDKVDANTFVEFVSKLGMKDLGSAVQISDAAYMPYPKSIRAVYLSENKVFVVYPHYASATETYTRASILTIEDNVITIASSKNIGTNASKYYWPEDIDAVALSSTKVFIVLGDFESVNQVSGLVCTISGTTIIAGSLTEIVFAPSTGDLAGRSVTALSSSKVVIIYVTANKTYAIVCNVSGTTITKGTSVAIVSKTIGASTSYNLTSVIAVSGTKFCAFCASSVGTGYGVVCTVSGTTITVGTEIDLGSVSLVSGIDSILLPDGHILLNYGLSNKAYVKLIEVSGTAMSVLATVEAISLTTIYHMEMALLSDNYAVLVAQQSGPKIYAVLIKIDGTSIQVGAPTLLVSSTATTNISNLCPHVGKADSDSFVVAYSLYQNSNYYPFSIACTVEAYEGITPLTANANFLGITRTKATTTKPGKVWVLA